MVFKASLLLIAISLVKTSWCAPDSKGYTKDNCNQKNLVNTACDEDSFSSSTNCAKAEVQSEYNAQCSSLAFFDEESKISCDNEECVSLESDCKEESECAVDSWIEGAAKMNNYDILSQMSDITENFYMDWYNVDKCNAKSTMCSGSQNYNKCCYFSYYDLDTDSYDACHASNYDERKCASDRSYNAAALNTRSAECDQLRVQDFKQSYDSEFEADNNCCASYDDKIWATDNNYNIYFNQDNCREKSYGVDVGCCKKDICGECTGNINTCDSKPSDTCGFVSYD